MMAGWTTPTRSTSAVTNEDPQRPEEFIRKIPDSVCTVINGYRSEAAVTRGLMLATMILHVILAMDGSAAVALPEVPLLGCCRAPAD